MPDRVTMISRKLLEDFLIICDERERLSREIKKILATSDENSFHPNWFSVQMDDSLYELLIRELKNMDLAV